MFLVEWSQSQRGFDSWVPVYPLLGEHSRMCCTLNSFRCLSQLPMASVAAFSVMVAARQTPKKHAQPQPSVASVPPRLKAPGV